MTLLTWRNQYALGIPEIDHEHQEMIRVINELHDRMMARPTTDEIADFLSEISVLIGAHFALEERTMRLMRYSEYAAHKADHEHLLEEILDIADGFTADPGSEIDTLGERLSRWFGDHFRTFDARLHRADGRK